jgi:hypothetical protein
MRVFVVVERFQQQSKKKENRSQGGYHFYVPKTQPDIRQLKLP